MVISQYNSSIFSVEEEACNPFGYEDTNTYNEDDSGRNTGMIIGIVVGAFGTFSSFGVWRHLRLCF